MVSTAERLLHNAPLTRYCRPSPCGCANQAHGEQGDVGARKCLLQSAAFPSGRAALRKTGRPFVFSPRSRRVCSLSTLGIWRRLPTAALVPVGAPSSGRRLLQTSDPARSIASSTGPSRCADGWRCTEAQQSQSRLRPLVEQASRTKLWCREAVCERCEYSADRCGDCAGDEDESGGE